MAARAGGVPRRTVSAFVDVNAVHTVWLESGHVYIDECDPTASHERDDAMNGIILRRGQHGHRRWVFVYRGAVMRRARWQHDSTRTDENQFGGIHHLRLLDSGFNP